MQRRNFPHLLVVVFTFLAMSVVWVVPFNSSAGAVSCPTFGEFGFANSEHGADLAGCVYAGFGLNADLGGANLTGADLAGTSFYLGGTLGGANLTGPTSPRRTCATRPWPGRLLPTPTWSAYSSTA